MSIHLYLFLSLAYSPLSLYQSKFTPISFSPVFFISVFTLFIDLYLYMDRLKIEKDRYSRTSDRLRDRKRCIFLVMVDTGLEIKRHNALGMQSG